MTATDRLDAITARLDAVGWAPWEIKRERREAPAVWHDGEAAYPIGACGDCGHEAVYSPADADLIAHAPTDLAATVAALRAVLDLHAPEPYGSPDMRRYAPWVPETICAACLADADGCVPYPCPTVTAITRHLETR